LCILVLFVFLSSLPSLWLFSPSDLRGIVFTSRMCESAFDTICRRWHMKRDRGFRRFRLTVLVTVVLLIAFIAIPNLIRSRRAMRESSAIAGIRAINVAEVTYLSTGGSFGGVPQLIDAGLLDRRFATSVSGYSFAISTSGLDYTATATPAAVNGGRVYYSGPDSVIRQSSPRT
jgi:type IV pilus assembly protein PilA